MCGRYALYAETQELIDTYGIERDAHTPQLQPRYNIAPTQQVPVIVLERGVRRLREVRWGLVPAQWASPDERRAPLINARAESIASRPVFRNAFARSRCIVPASGYFEWRTERGTRQPYFFGLRSAAPLALAGICDLWQRDGLPPVASCAIVTVPPNDLTAPLHDRMPAVLDAAGRPGTLEAATADAVDPSATGISPAGTGGATEAWRWWLDPATPRPLLAALLGPLADHLMFMHPVTPRMNHYAYEEADAVLPVTPHAAAAQAASPELELNFPTPARSSDPDSTPDR